MVGRAHVDFHCYRPRLVDSTQNFLLLLLISKSRYVLLCIELLKKFTCNLLSQIRYNNFLEFHLQYDYFQLESLCNSFETSSIFARNLLKKRSIHIFLSIFHK